MVKNNLFKNSYHKNKLCVGEAAKKLLVQSELSDVMTHKKHFVEKKLPHHQRQDI
jgi:hypothetical protein